MISRPSFFSRRENPYVLFAICVAVIVGFTVLRSIFAARVELRVDEAYYWTWSKENVISYFDHPPMIAWWVRFGTFLFGDTNFGVRFTGLLAMPLMQLLLADIVWRTVRDFRYIIAVVLLPEAAVDDGLLMAKVGPDTPLIPFALALVWALVRLALSGDFRWWLGGGRLRWPRAAVEIHGCSFGTRDLGFCGRPALARETSFSALVSGLVASSHLLFSRL